MVNTTMNHSREFKKMKYTWIDIEGTKKEKYTFKELQSESSDDKAIYSEASISILASSMFDLVKKYYPSSIFTERKIPQGKTEDEQDQTWKQTWSEFEEHAKVILTFLKVSQKKSDETLQRLRDMFKELGDGEESQGFQLFNQLDRYIKECGGDKTQPKMTAKLLLAQWSAKEIKELFNLFNVVKKSNSSLFKAL